MLNGVAIGSLFFLIAVGLSLVFGIMDILNLAHGSVALLGAYMGVVLIGPAQDVGSYALAAVVALACGVGSGFILTLLARPVRDHLRQAMLTLGIALIAADLLTQAFGADVHSVPAPAFLDGSIEVLGGQYPLYRIWVIIASIIIGVVLYLVIERTQIGAVVRATVADRTMVEAIGIRTFWILGVVFGLGAGLASLGGLMAGPILGAQPGLDNRILLLALVVVVVGGLGSVKGAAVGALLVGQVETLGVSLLPDLASFLLFGAMAIVLLVKPRGLLPAGYFSTAARK